jgi:hypothetical protein
MPFAPTPEVFVPKPYEGNKLIVSVEANEELQASLALDGLLSFYRRDMSGWVNMFVGPVSDAERTVPAYLRGIGRLPYGLRYEEIPDTNTARLDLIRLSGGAAAAPRRHRPETASEVPVFDVNEEGVTDISTAKPLRFPRDEPTLVLIGPTHDGGQTIDVYLGFSNVGAALLYDTRALRAVEGLKGHTIATEATT